MLCLFVCSHISESTRPTFGKCVRGTSGRGAYEDCPKVEEGDDRKLVLAQNPNLNIDFR